MSGIVLEQLTKTFGGHVALDHVDLTIAAGEIVALLGPSGCGKTTTLRCIAGLEQPTSGLIRIGEQVVYSSADNIMVPPERRRIGLVFQSYALWPHLTVRQNVAYGLEVQRVPKAEIEARVQRVLDMVGLAKFKDRYPGTMSGGQQQRVALARCLVTEPEVLLLDEPLSNLDMKLREYMRSELRELIKLMKLTAVYVTHDPGEALILADKIVLMHDGRVVEIGSPQALYSKPRTRAAFEFLGQTNYIDGELVERLDGGFSIRTKWGQVMKSTAGPVPRREAGSTGGSLCFGIRPENIHITAEPPEESAAQNVLQGTVADVTFLGNVVFYKVDCRNIELRVQTSQALFDVGDRVYLRIAPEWLLAMEA